MSRLTRCVLFQLPYCICFINVSNFIAQHPSNRELIEGHLEAVALQQKYGTTYKDACHRLYHQYHERATNAENNLKAWTALELSLRNSLDYMENHEITLNKEKESSAHAKPDSGPSAISKGKQRANYS